MATVTGQSQPNPEVIFETLNAYQQTAALKAAIELDIFTAIAEGANTPSALAKRCQAAERGVRILSDYLTINGFLTKEAGRYALTRDSAIFLDRRSPACVASAVGFLAMPNMTDAFKDLAAAVRKGGSVLPGEAAIEANNPLWVEFARSMAPLQGFVAEMIAENLKADAGDKWKVLDIAAGHGMFGIAVAKHNPNAEIYALDWASVLEVAKENAQAAGISSRFHMLPGSAFDVDFGSGYDLILLTNFLHHYDPVMIEILLRKVRAALAPNGRAVTLEFIPNEDRVTPPRAAAFSLIMLAATPEGDAYTFSEYQRMFRDAGFSSNELRDLHNGPHRLIISQK
jgi:2-polyprenyl-3-methyl-5-hydroxy-6-metoxy-1,4-benzoquinol methylase